MAEGCDRPEVLRSAGWHLARLATIGRQMFLQRAAAGAFTVAEVARSEDLAQTLFQGAWGVDADHGRPGTVETRHRATSNARCRREPITRRLSGRGRVRAYRGRPAGAPETLRLWRLVTSTRSTWAFLLASSERAWRCTRREGSAASGGVRRPGRDRRRQARFRLGGTSRRSWVFSPVLTTGDPRRGAGGELRGPGCNLG